jgi:pimeloyl-ACP methyl ester carboxylesterase
MHVEVEGTRLWFDVEGAKLVPDGREMRERPTVVLLHGGPGSFDHSYFKPDFAPLAAVAQVVYLDLPGHGRSDWGDPAEWSFEACADAVRRFCDAAGIVEPVVYGHSLGGFVAMVYALRHPGHARALVLQSTYARADLERIVAEFRRRGGDEVAATVERVYGGDSLSVTPEEWAPCWRLFGPRVPSEEERARTVVNRGAERAGPRADESVRRPPRAGRHRVPDPRLRRRARPHHARRGRSRDRRRSPPQQAGDPRRRRSLPLEGRPGSLLAAPRRFRHWARIGTEAPFYGADH